MRFAPAAARNAAAMLERPEEEFRGAVAQSRRARASRVART